MGRVWHDEPDSEGFTWSRSEGRYMPERFTWVSVVEPAVPSRPDWRKVRNLVAITVAVWLVLAGVMLWASNAFAASSGELPDCRYGSTVVVGWDSPVSCDLNPPDHLAIVPAPGEARDPVKCWNRGGYVIDTGSVWVCASVDY